MTPENNKKRAWQTRLIPIVAAIYLAGLAVFAWGYMSFKYKVFPHQLIVDMQGALQSLEAQSELRENPRSAHEIVIDLEAGGVTVDALTDSRDDLLFTTRFRDGQFVADLLNRKGEVEYEWRIPHGKIDMSKALDRAVVLMVRNQSIHGAHLSPNGDVLLVNEYHGMVKLNRNSEVMWRTKEANHHAVTVGPDGSIWSLSRNELKDKQHWVAAARRPYVDDTVVRYTPEGELVEEFSVMEVIEKNAYEGILYAGPARAPRLADRDPIHLNDIDVLTATQAAHFPNVEAGDLMLSMRTVNAIIIVRPQTKAIVWSMTGPFLRQHDPQVTRDGLLLVYDNRTTVAQLGGNARYLRKKQKLGYSRLLAIDPTARDIRWQYVGTPERPFYSSIQGKHHELPNGDIIAVEPEGGRIFQVSRATGEIVWEYINILEPGIAGRITQATPFPRNELAFLNAVTAE